MNKIDSKIYYSKNISELLKNKNKIYYIKENNHGIINYIIYINDKKLNKNDIKEANAIIEILIDPLLCETSITSIITKPKYRGNGLASFLILIAAEICKKYSKIIELDDMTDNAFKKNNIYKQMGFFYITKYEPEMRGSPTYILEKIKKFKDKYSGNNFFK